MYGTEVKLYHDAQARDNVMKMNQKNNKSVQQITLQILKLYSHEFSDFIS